MHLNQSLTTPGCIPAKNFNKGLRYKSGLFFVTALMAATLSLAGCTDMDNRSTAQMPTDRTSIVGYENGSLDLDGSGPYDQIVHEYSIFPVQYVNGEQIVTGEVDAKVTLSAEGDQPVKTDVRGVIHIPTSADEGLNQGPFPLVVLLHGNYAQCRVVENAPELPPGTCDISKSHASMGEDGKCNCAKYEEVPSYRGFEQIASHLASHGYIVASVNANLGLYNKRFGPLLHPTLSKLDPFGILTRGRLVLKHLSLFRMLHDGTAANDAGIGADLFGKVDFRHVGLAGHSRGGEAMRAVQYLYEAADPDSYASDLKNIIVNADPNSADGIVATDMVIEGIFEIAPTNYGAQPLSPEELFHPMNATGVSRSVLIGTCDKDVESYPGMLPFLDRRATDSASRAFSSVFIVPGANHESFNSEWTVESDTCVTDAWNVNVDELGVIQQQIAKYTTTAFMKGFVGNLENRKSFQKVFDPQYTLPSQLKNLIPVPMLRESIQHSTSTTTTTLGEALPGSAGRDTTIYVVNEIATGNERKLRRIEWADNGASYSAFFENGAISSDTVKRLRFSVAPAASDVGISPDGQPLNFSIQLIFNDDVESLSMPVNVSEYSLLNHRLNNIDGCGKWGEQYGENCKFDMNAMKQMPYNLNGCMAAADSLEKCFDYEFIDEDGNERGQCFVYCEEKYTRYMLFDQISMEIEDFDINSNRQIKGLRFSFDKTPSGQLFLDRTITVDLKPVLGDVDENRVVNIVDSLLIAQNYVGNPIASYFNPDQGDVNCDGRVTIADAQLISNYFTFGGSPFECEQIVPFDMCGCNSSKCTECASQIAACKGTPGCGDIIQCTFENDCVFPSETCYDGRTCHQITGYSQQSIEGQTANNLISCMSGC